MKDSVLILNTSCGKILIDINTITRVEASSNYCRLFFRNGETLVTAKVLKWFEQKLPKHGFVRMNRSHLVNNQFLKPNQVITTGLVLQNGEFIQLSRRRRKEILNQLLVA